MERNANLDRIEIILTDTQDAANIGSVCRAMKTMGISKLTVVSRNVYDENRIRTLALHAFDLWETHRNCSDLDEALSDSILAVAATRRHGKNRKTSNVTPEELAEKISAMPEGKISIVFGCESSGLTDAQVEKCSMVVTVPTSSEFPSLNLAQAVQIVCYALFTRLKTYRSSGNAVTLQRISQSVEKCIEALDDIKYFKSEDERKFTAEFLKDQFARSYMTESEIKRFEKIFTKRTSIIRFKRNLQNSDL